MSRLTLKQYYEAFGESLRNSHEYFDTTSDESYNANIKTVINGTINKIVCSFNVCKPLNLKHIALKSANVEYNRVNNKVIMKIRKPAWTAHIWASGKVTCAGATSETDAKLAARRFARLIQKLGYTDVKMSGYRIVNVFANCCMPFAINIKDLALNNKYDAFYEPEHHAGLTYKLKYPKATLKIFLTGSVTITSSSVQNVLTAVELIYPLLYEYRKERTGEYMTPRKYRKKHKLNKRKSRR